MTARGHWFSVVTAEYGTVIPILDDGSGPMEYGCDAVRVYARTRRRAKVLAVRVLRRYFAGRWRKPGYLEDGSPFTGMKVYDALPHSEEDRVADEWEAENEPGAREVAP